MYAKRKTKNEANGRISIIPRLTHQQAMADFQRTLKGVSPNDGAWGGKLDKLCFAGEALLASKPSFLFADFLALTKGFDEIEIADVKEFYGKWTDELVRMCKLETSPSCYGEETLFVVV